LHKVLKHLPFRHETKARTIQLCHLGDSRSRQDPHRKHSDHLDATTPLQSDCISAFSTPPVNARPSLHQLSPRGRYPRQAERPHDPPIHPLHPPLLPPLARLDHLQPHRALSPGPLPSLSSSSDEEADQIDDTILEADAEDICPRCLDRLAWAVWRLPRTKIVLSGHYALSQLQKRERRDGEGDLREVLGIREEPVGQEEQLLGKAGKGWGGGLRRWVIRERVKDRAEAEAEEGRGDGV